MSVCLSTDKMGSECMHQPHTVLFSRGLIYGKMFYFLEQENLLFYVYPKKKTTREQERCTFLTIHKTKRTLDAFYFSCKWRNNNNNTKNLGQPTMNILTILCMVKKREWKTIFFLSLMLFSWFKSQNNTTHISCKRRQQSALLLREIELQHIRFSFLFPRDFICKHTHTFTQRKITENILFCFILYYFYLLQILSIPCTNL